MLVGALAVGVEVAILGEGTDGAVSDVVDLEPT